MPVKPRGNSWEASVAKNNRRFRRSFLSKVEAEAWEQESKAALLRGEAPDMGNASGVTTTNMTMKELYQYTAKNRWAGKSTSLSRNGNTCVDTIGPGVLVSKVDMLVVDRCIHTWVDQGNTGATVNRKLAALSTMLTEAQRLGVIASKPYLRRQKESEHRLRFYSTEEEEAIIKYFKHIGQHEMADLCILGVDTGLRLGNLLALHSSQITAEEKPWIVIAGSSMKNGKSHTVPLTTRAVEIVRRLSGNAPCSLFSLTNNSVHHYWKAMRDHVFPNDQDQVVFHLFRHTFCSRLVQRGVPIEVVQRLAGHETLQMTMRYAKLAPRNLTTAIDVLEQTP